MTFNGVSHILGFAASRTYGKLRQCWLCPLQTLCWLCGGRRRSIFISVKQTKAYNFNIISIITKPGNQEGKWPSCWPRMHAIQCYLCCVAPTSQSMP